MGEKISPRSVIPIPFPTLLVDRRRCPAGGIGGGVVAVGGGVEALEAVIIWAQICRAESVGRAHCLIDKIPSSCADPCATAAWIVAAAAGSEVQAGLLGVIQW